jgi:hypothetical protein
MMESLNEVSGLRMYSSNRECQDDTPTHYVVSMLGAYFGIMAGNIAVRFGLSRRRV